MAFYAFDSLAFLSSSYDHQLRLYSSTTLAPSASFDLASVVYSHAMSPVATHLLVACATQHPAVRLVDLRSGAATHSLVGHGGSAVFSVAWSPRDEHVLASAGGDGTVRFWDVRRSAGALGMLDLENSVGVGVQRGQARRGKAHSGPANGVVWTEDGRYLVSVGHDEKIRVWNTETGANTLASFGPVVRNRHLSALLPLVAPRGLVASGMDCLFYPSEGEILMYEMYEGRLVKKMRVPGVPMVRGDGGQRNVRNRVTALAWRSHDVELFSAHGDGTIRSWRPRTTEDAIVDEDDQSDESDGAGSRKRKRQVLRDIHRDLTTPKVTYI